MIRYYPNIGNNGFAFLPASQKVKNMANFSPEIESFVADALPELLI